MRTKKCVMLSLASAAVASVASLPATADTGTFSTLVYNVAGLLEPFSSSNPDVNTPLISCAIRGYTLVNVQEDFNYHAALYDTCDDHTYRSATTGGMGIGSGLNTLSYLPYMDWYQGDWDSCNGVDCLTPKGWTHARVRMNEGTFVSLYNLHTQAQTESADLKARRDNILQLLEYIEYESPTDAIIVMGDTNTRYTRSGDNTREFLKRGFTDVWINNVRGGAVPAVDDNSLVSCADRSSASCEIVDKVFFRNNGHLTLSALSFLVDDVNFVDSAGNQLSDHFPVAVDWSYSTSPSFKLSDQLGGPHGTAFNDVGLLPSNPKVSKLVIRTGSRVDRVEVVLSNSYILSHGGTGGTEASLALSGNEYLSSVDLCSAQYSGHTRVFYTKFTTSTGRTLAGGSTTSSCVKYTAPSGYQISGFHGRAGDEVDRLGVVYTPVLSYTPEAASYFQIVNRNSGLCMDIAGAQMSPGTNVLQWYCSGDNWQKWSYDPTTGLIRSLNDPRYCLDNNGYYDDGADLKIWTCNGNANQRFTLNANDGTIRSRTNPIQVVDAVGAAAGNDIITYSDWGGTNQRWALVR
jgi:endonuclease/exonuclease/phosphatase family metal-dependent hydrolase